MGYLVDRWNRIGARLYLALGFAVLLTLVSSAVGVYYFERSGDLNFRVQSEAVPMLEASWAAAREAERLKSAGLPLTADSSADVQLLSREPVEGMVERLDGRLGDVSAVPVLANHAEDVQGAAYRLLSIIDDLSVNRAALAEINGSATQLQSRLAKVPAESGADREALGLLRRATLAQSQPELDSRWDEFVGLSQGGFSAELAELGGGDAGVFAVRGRQVALQTRIDELTVEFNQLSRNLDDAVAGLVQAAEAESDQALAATQGSFDRGRILLAVISIASVVAATLASWLWVGNGVVSRLSRLSERMRRMAGGDLEMPVPEVGRDEIGELAHALEVFRQQALEVQRLNLVEQLYGELRQANEELTRMQDRLVAQEKLAALGELVSGVAHEISNPLNFIKNFSEGSLDLYKELSEMLDGYRSTMSEDDAALLDEVSGELIESLERVCANGGRVLSIVDRMQGLGIVGGEPVAVDVNDAVRSATRSACAAFEAEWGDFAVEPSFNLDGSAGSLQLVANDFGEALKNLVSNACYAMRAKRNSGGAGYEPSLVVSTRREDGNVVLSFWDNGTGIPDDIVGHIFNPFFSTREGVLGAGLGLPVASDVVRRAGGTIAFDTVPGEYADFSVSLPTGVAASVG